MEQNQKLMNHNQIEPTSPEGSKQQLNAWCKIVLLGGFLLAMLLWQIISPDQKMSDSERRALKAFPEFSVSRVQKGSFMSEFETYTQDQFPLRDVFRGWKSFAALYLFGQKEVHDLYLKDGVVAKVEYPYDRQMLDHALERFQYLYDTYLKGTEVQIYGCIVPDKHYYLAKEAGYPAMDYEKQAADFKAGASYMKMIEIADLLTAEDYYRTDSHWRQERLLPVAQRIGEEMKVPVCGVETNTAGHENEWNTTGTSVAGHVNEWNASETNIASRDDEYTKVLLERPFYGVYAGQIALPIAPDELYYLTSERLNACRVTSYSTGKAKESVMYNLKKAAGRDPYELFLSGSEPLLVIENPNALSDKELILFRDSFGSSLTPLLVGSYAKVTVIDIRYVRSELLGNFVDFTDQDVLFLYSALMLNNSLSFQ